jgi:hypothetical protein
LSERASPHPQPLEAGDEWLEESAELPPRPRRRMLTPLSLGLLAVLLTACGFIGGVLVEKGQGASGSSSPASAAGFASRLSALRAGGSSALGRSASTGGAASGSSGLGGGGRPVSGQVAYVAGSTLYVTNSEGNTMKVTTSPATSVTKTVKASVKDIHPGETVTVTGAAGSNGAVGAESISVGSGGALAALFGAGSGGGSRSAGAGAPSLFGNGG